MKAATPIAVATMLIAAPPAWSAKLIAPSERMVVPAHPMKNLRPASPGIPHPGSGSLRLNSPPSVVRMPKLSVVNFKVTPGLVRPGQPIFVHVTVRNEGKVLSSPGTRKFVVLCTGLGPGDDQLDGFKHATLPDGTIWKVVMNSGCVRALPHQHVIGNPVTVLTPSWTFLLPAIPPHGEVGVEFRINENWNWGDLRYHFSYFNPDGSLPPHPFWIGDANVVEVKP